MNETLYRILLFHSYQSDANFKTLKIRSFFIGFIYFFCIEPDIIYLKSVPSNHLAYVMNTPIKSHKLKTT